MGQHHKPRHAKPITRDDLLHRLARATGLTYGEAWDFAGDMTDERLSQHVEETERVRSQPGRRRSFARSQPTTSVQGQTR
jgi:hypothetical protein